MRRVVLLVLLLGSLSLASAFATTFDVTSGNISTFTTEVSISVPTTTAAPVQFAEMRLIGLPEEAALVLPPTVDTDPRTKTAKFQPNQLAVEIEDGEPGTGGRVDYISWISDTFASGLTFGGKTVRLELDRKDAVQLTAGLFDCPPTEPRATVAPGCRLIKTGSSTTQDIDIGPIVHSVDGGVAPGNQLRLKIVNNSGTESTIQWGFNSARLVRLVAL